jgi:hypothetical protein
MKKALLFFLLCVHLVNAQSNSKAIKQAKELFNTDNPAYDAAKGFASIKHLALTGEAEAMNAVGILYQKGLGTEPSDEEAFKWFTAAANAGYGQAWYNLGLMHKNGLGTPEDLNKAYQCFDKGATLRTIACYYGKGYMLYKGLGCQQNYVQSIELFQKAVRNGSLGSMYMLGLCYRNGYGTAVNRDSATYWLQRASELGYSRAAEELSKNDSELSSNQASDRQKPLIPKIKSNLLLSAKNSNRESKQLKLNGVYTGYVVRYDWSGKYVINTNKLSLSIQTRDIGTTGLWCEEGGKPVPISGNISDSLITFSSPPYQHSDRYSQGSNVESAFKDCHLRLVTTADTVYLAGTIRPYSVSGHDYDQPMYIYITKTADAITNSTGRKSKNSSIMNNTLSSALGLTAYPNPFDKDITLSFNLLDDGVVNIVIQNLTGEVVYKESSIKLKAGAQVRRISTTVAEGAYVLKVTSNGVTSSTIIVKQK